MDAFASIYEQGITRTIEAALIILQDEDWARDVAHDVFLRLWTSGRWRSLTHPLAYLETASRREATRRLQRRRKITVTLDRIPDRALDPMEAMLRREQTHRVRSCLLQLPKRRRRVMNLSLCHGWSRGAIANRLGISVKGVERQITLGRLSLRGCLRAPPVVSRHITPGGDDRKEN